MPIRVVGGGNVTILNVCSTHHEHYQKQEAVDGREERNITGSDDYGYVTDAYSLTASEQNNYLSLCLSNQNNAINVAAGSGSSPLAVAQRVTETNSTHGFTSFLVDYEVIDRKTRVTNHQRASCPLSHLASISSKLHDKQTRQQLNQQRQDLQSNVFVQTEDDNNISWETNHCIKRQKSLHHHQNNIDENDDETRLDCNIPVFDLGSREAIRQVSSPDHDTKNASVQGDSSYFDFSNETLITEVVSRCIAQKGTATFPVKLHEALEKIECDGHADIIGWLQHGRSFKIHKHKEFAELILPQYFVMTKKSSFLRQLNLYSFNRISTGSRLRKSKNTASDQNSYYHERFLRGLPHLCQTMKRIKVNGNIIRTASNPDNEPEFALFPPCLSTRLLIDTSTGIESRNSTNNGVVLKKYGIESVSMVEEETQYKKRLRNLAIKTCHPEQLMLGSASSFSIAAKKKSQHKAFECDLITDTTNKIRAASTDGLDLLVSQLPDDPNFVARLNRNSVSLEHLYFTNSIEQPLNKFESSLSSPDFSPWLSHSNSAIKEEEERISSALVSTFPLKLQRILDKLETENSVDIISWLPHGRAFRLHDVSRFVTELMPQFFNQTKYSSFQRQLHMYNFQRITSKTNKDKGSYHHPSFIRGEPDKAGLIRRMRVNGKGTRQPGNPSSEPNFYLLPVIPSLVIETKETVR
jgi:HSF-type DNA-binding